MKNTKNYIDYLVREVIPYADIAVHKDGKEIFRYYAGEGATGKEKLFIFSCTKPVTVTLTMRLIEEGYLKLCDKVEKYLPAFKNLYYLRDGKRCAPSTPPTVYHLMTMTSGLSYDLEGFPFEEYVAAHPEMSPTVAAMNALSEGPLLCDVGEKYNYSLSHDALGAVLEVATGERLSALMKRYIFDPLGMRDTYFCRAHDDSIAPIFRAGDSGIEPTRKINNFVLAEGYESGGAGLVSTVSDYVKFVDALTLGGISPSGVRIISEKSLLELRTVRIAPITVGGAYTSVDGTQYGYGLGVRVRTARSDWGLPVGEFGWDGAAGSYLMADPVNKISVFFGAHVRVWTKVLAGKHLELVRRVYEDLGIK